jgi:hypothetical protein
MSTLKVDTIKDTSGVEVYTAKAWVNFDGTFGTDPFTIANGGIRAAGNVSSVTDNGTGDYTVNFTSAMPDANYAWSYGSQYNNSGAVARQNIFPMMNDGASLVQTTSIRFFTGTTTAYHDSAIVTLSVFR